MSDTVRLGIIGAGSYTRSRMLPNFLNIPGVHVAAVANRSVESARKVTEKFHIADALDDWRALLERDDIDAVLIGTPPYAHREIAVAAMDAGKHVLCQTRMATTLEEARAMSRKATETGRRAALVRPSRYITAGRFLKHLLETGYAGNVRQVFCYRLIPDYADPSAPLGRRQDAELYGETNCLYLGYCWDVLRDWFGEPKRVLAHAVNFTPRRPAGPDGPLVDVRTPEAVTAIAEMESGASVTSVQSGLAHFGVDRIEVYGDRGTLVYEADSDRLLGARAGSENLAPLDVPPEFADSWTVERDFIRMVRGEIEQMFLTFEAGVENMAYLDACHRSALEGRWVDQGAALDP